MVPDSQIPERLCICKDAALPDLEIETWAGNDGTNGTLKVEVHNWDVLMRIADETDDDVLRDSLRSAQLALRDCCQGGDVWDADTHTMIIENGEPVPIQQARITAPPGSDQEQGC